MSDVAELAHACSTHQPYQLSCDEYDEIRSRYDGLCWRCQDRPGEHVDHDHSRGMAAVRGYLCLFCNLGMIRVDREGWPSAIDVDYLARAWFTGRTIPYIDDPRTKLRNVRVDDSLWEAAKPIASERRETLSTVIKRALVEYVERHGGRIDR